MSPHHCLGSPNSGLGWHNQSQTTAQPRPNPARPNQRQTKANPRPNQRQTNTKTKPHTKAKARPNQAKPTPPPPPCKILLSKARGAAQQEACTCINNNIIRWVRGLPVSALVQGFSSFRLVWGLVWVGLAMCVCVCFVESLRFPT